MISPCAYTCTGGGGGGGGGGVSYIRNGIRVSEYGGLIHGVLYWRGGGAYIWRFTVYVFRHS
jgi:hypothetical protein